MGCTTGTPEGHSEDAHQMNVWPQEGHSREVHHWQKSLGWQHIQQDEEGRSHKCVHAES